MSQTVTQILRHWQFWICLGALKHVVEYAEQEVEVVNDTRSSNSLIAVRNPHPQVLFCMIY